MSAPARRPAVFLDRDGTLNEEVDFLARAEELVLIPGAAQAVRALNEAGFAAVLVTNQSGLARGLFSASALEAIHARLALELGRAGAHLDAIYVCPHHPSEGSPPLRRDCDCRKPAPGLLVRAARELDLDLERSWVVGDAERDLEAGAALGLPGILVETGKGRAELERMRRLGHPPPQVAADVGSAVQRILAARAPHFS